MHSAPFCKPNSVTHTRWQRQLINNPLKTSLQSLMPTIQPALYSLNPTPKIELWRTDRENELELNIHNLEFPDCQVLLYYHTNPIFQIMARSALSPLYSTPGVSRWEPPGALSEEYHKRKREVSQVTYTFLTKGHRVLFTAETFLLSYQLWLIPCMQAMVYARKHWRDLERIYK